MEVFRSLLTYTALACLATSAMGQSIDNKGTDFIMAWLKSFSGGTPLVEVHLTSDVATMVTVEYPVNAPTFSTTVAVNPGAITVVSLPSPNTTSGVSNGWVENTISNNCVRAFADDEFVAYMINRVMFTSDAALALPIDTMNTEYLVMDYSGLTRSHFVVYAGFDDTEVTITPTAALVGHAAGVPFTITLQRGEGYLGYAAGAPANLTGTKVSADRPVGLSNGNACTNVPNNFGACDHLMEVAQPVQSWGLHVLVSDLPDRPNGALYRILASEDATTVTQDGGPLAVLNAGQFFETPFLAGNHEFEADKPIFVEQFMPGQGSPGATTGDPAMGNMIPCEQYLTDYTFSSVGGGQFALHFLAVYADNADLATILLDGAPIGAGAFTPIGASGFSAALLSLAEGAHTTSSTNPHGIVVSGLNSFDSYLYPGGALFQFINPVGDANPPMCEIVNDDSEAFACGTATDNRPSEDTNGNGILDPGEDLNMNGLIDVDTGIFFVVLKDGSENVELVVDPFVPGDGVVEFKVNLICDVLPGSGSICITDGAGNETNCDVSLNEPIGSSYCGPAVPNSTGESGQLICTGSDVAADENVTLVGVNLPPGNVCLFLASMNQGLIQPPRSCGPICLMGPDIARFKFDAQVIGDDGKCSLTIDPFIVLTNPPQPILAGQTWNFQAWHRDSGAGPDCNNNFTDACSITFQ